MRGQWTDWIYGIADNEVTSGSGYITAKCFSPMCHDGESGPVDASKISFVSADDFREAVISFIKERVTSEEHRRDRIEAIERIIKEKGIGQ